MSKSYNGCPASTNKNVINVDPNWGMTWKKKKMIWPGGVGQNKDLQDCFRYYVEQFYARVEDPVHTDYSKAGNWGYAYRANVNNPNSLSCHASGTAIDTNAVRHPNGSRNTFTKKQYTEIGKILDELDNVLIIGVPGFKTPRGKVGGWTAASRPDEMHVEAASYNPDAWKKAAQKIRARLGSATPAVDAVKPAKNTQTADGQITVENVTVKKVQKRLNDHGANLVVDGIFGTKTVKAVRKFQTQHALRVDGIVGDITWNALKASHPKSAPYPLKGKQVFGLWNEPGLAKYTRSGDPRWDGQDIRNLIKAIQDRLQELKFGRARKKWPNGRYLKPMKKVVKKFQKSRGLPKTGVVDATTWKALFA